jgi:hypothetical protein
MTLWWAWGRNNCSHTILILIKLSCVRRYFIYSYLRPLPVHLLELWVRIPPGALMSASCWVFRVFRQRSRRWPDHLSRGVLPNVIVKSRQCGGHGRLRATAPWKKNVRRCQFLRLYRISDEWMNMHHWQNGTDSVNQWQNGTESMHHWHNGTDSMHHLQNDTDSMHHWHNGTDRMHHWQNGTVMGNPKYSLKICPIATLSSTMQLLTENKLSKN